MEQRKKRQYAEDLTEGSLLPKMIRYTIPVVLTGILQLLFNSADMIVVGRYAGNSSLAAVGSTGSLINLLITVSIGLSVGAAVTAAQAWGAHDDGTETKIVHTAAATALVCGGLVMLVGCIFGPVFLAWMGTPDDVIGLASLYIRIYFLAMPATMLYNFLSAVLRSIGDTRHPLLFLSVAGAINVVLNLVFVIGFHMDVAGVAAATVISQYFSAAWIALFMMKRTDCCRLEWRKIRFHKQQVIRFLQIGLPAGLQGALFSVSNVLIQSSVNSFGQLAMAGSSASANVEGFIYIAMNSVYQTEVAFAGQNAGARKYRRVVTSLLLGLAMVTIIGVVLGVAANLASEQLIGLFTKADDAGTPVTVAYGMERLGVIAKTYFLCGVMEAVVGAIRGLGISLPPTLITLVGVCGLRVAWLYTVFAANRTITTLYYSYPVSWILTTVGLVVLFVVKLKKRMRESE